MIPPSCYAFETSEFGLDDKGLHRLRSRFPFETVAYAAIIRAEVRRGRTVQNWWLLLAFGLLCAGLYVAYNIYLFFSFGHGRITVQELVVPVIPGCIGVAAIVQALQVGDILIVYTKRRKLLFPLDKLKSGNLLALPVYLATHLDNDILQ